MARGGGPSSDAPPREDPPAAVVIFDPGELAREVLARVRLDVAAIIDTIALQELWVFGQRMERGAARPVAKHCWGRTRKRSHNGPRVPPIGVPLPPGEEDDVNNVNGGMQG